MYDHFLSSQLSHSTCSEGNTILVLRNLNIRRVKYYKTSFPDIERHSTLHCHKSYELKRYAIRHWLRFLHF